MGRNHWQLAAVLLTALALGACGQNNARNFNNPGLFNPNGGGVGGFGGVNGCVPLVQGSQIPFSGQNVYRDTFSIRAGQGQVVIGNQGLVGGAGVGGFGQSFQSYTGGTNPGSAAAITIQVFQANGNNGAAFANYSTQANVNGFLVLGAQGYAQVLLEATQRGLLAGVGSGAINPAVGGPALNPAFNNGFAGVNPALALCANGLALDLGIAAGTVYGAVQLQINGQPLSPMFIQ